MPAQYLPTVAWETIVRDVVVVDATHYYVSVYPENPNDPGSDLLSASVGQYLKDWIGHTYKIVEVNVGGVPLRLKVEDSFLTGVGPQQGLTGVVYQSPSGSPFLAPIRHFRLDESALDYSRAIELDVLWNYRGFNGVGSGIDEVNITKLQLGTGVKYSDVTTGWGGGKSVTLGLINRYNSTGGIDNDTFTDNGNGSFSIPTRRYTLYDNPDGNGYSLEYSIAGNTFTPSDNTYAYVVANYNSGVPTLQLTTDVSIINETTIIPVLSVYRSGTILHVTPWDTLGSAKVDKIHQSIVKTQRYRRENGIAISVVATNKISLTSGIIWIGGVKRIIDQYTQGDSGGVTLALTKVSGVWTQAATTSFDTTIYQNGANVATLTNNRYCVLFVFRGVEANKHIYYVYGTGDFSETAAKASVIPSDLPPVITSHAVLVGRIISEKGSTAPLEVASAFDTVFATQAGAPSHNDLAGLQGVGNDYYHLSLAQYNGLTTGTLNYLPKYNATGITPSRIIDDGTNVTIGAYNGYPKAATGLLSWNASIPESDVSFTDITTGNASTSYHGYLKKLSGNANEFINGLGNWAVPSSGSGGAPAGTAYGDIQYRNTDGTAFAADTTLNFNPTTKALLAGRSFKDAPSYAQVSVGYDAGFNLTSQEYNCTFVGYGAGYQARGSSITALGKDAGRAAAGWHSCYIGAQSGNQIASGNGYNLYLGDNSGNSETSSSYKYVVETMRNSTKDYLVEGDFNSRWMRTNGASLQRVFAYTSSSALATGAGATMSTTVLTDSSKSFTVNQFAGKTLVITSTTNYNLSSYIISNTATTVRFAGAMTATTGVSYKIIDSIYITTEKLSSYYVIDISAGDGFGVTFPDVTSVNNGAVRTIIRAEGGGDISHGIYINSYTNGVTFYTGNSSMPYHSLTILNDRGTYEVICHNATNRHYDVFTLDSGVPF